MSGNQDLSKRIAAARKAALHRVHRTDDRWADDELAVDELDADLGSYKERCYNYRVLINKHEDTIRTQAEELREAKYDINVLKQKSEKEEEAKKKSGIETNKIVSSMKDLVNKTESMSIHRDNYLISECDKLIKSIATIESNTTSQNENYKIGGKAFLGIILKLKFEIEHMKEIVKGSIHQNSLEMNQIDSNHSHIFAIGEGLTSVHTAKTVTYKNVNYEEHHSNHNTFLDICTTLETENTALNSKIVELKSQIKEFEKNEVNFNKLISNYRNIIVGLKHDMSANKSQFERSVKELNNKVHNFSVDNSLLLKKVLAYEDTNSSDSIIRKKVVGLEHECLNIDKEIDLLQEEIEMNAKLLTKNYFMNIIQSI